MSGDNATSGENQQETARPRLDPMWVVGFVDGEGCFSVSVHQSSLVRQTRGWQLQPTFQVYQHERYREVLEDLISFFGIGRIRAKGPKSSVLTYAVDSLGDLEEGILPFFETHQLVVKAADFRLFAEIVRSMRRKEHLTPAGFEQAVRLAYAMNAQGKQRSRTLGNGPCRILRDCTPSTVVVLSGEDTVRSSWRHEEPGRNALAFLFGTRSNWK
jgi:hypothetical protein